MLVAAPEPGPGESAPTLEERSEGAGTELDVGYVTWGSREAEEARGFKVGFASWMMFAGSGGGRRPPDKKEGHKARSSGSDVPPEVEGAMCERMAAAFCLIRTGR